MMIMMWPKEKCRSQSVSHSPLRLSLRVLPIPSAVFCCSFSTLGVFICLYYHFRIYHKLFHSVHIHTHLGDAASSMLHHTVTHTDTHTYRDKHVRCVYAKQAHAMHLWSTGNAYWLFWHHRKCRCKCICLYVFVSVAVLRFCMHT